MGLFTNNNIQNISIGSNVSWYGNTMENAFFNCINFNSQITIPYGIVSMVNTFRNCKKFNHPVTIPNSVTSMASTFATCSNFNQPVTIPNSVKSLFSTFTGCTNFNQVVNIPNSITSLYSTFSNSGIKQLTIPKGATDLALTCMQCNNLTDLFILEDNVKNMYSMLASRNNTKRLNVYVNNKSNTRFMLQNCNLTHNIENRAFGSNNVSWTTSGVWLFNAAFNVYLYYRNYI